VTAAQRLLDAARHAHAELGDMALELHRIEQRIAEVRSQLRSAVTLYAPDTGPPPPDPGTEPRD
jgi:hypothetical protein